MKVKKGEDEGYIRALYVSEEAPVIEVEEPVVVNETQTSNTQSNRTQSSTGSSNHQVLIIVQIAVMDKLKTCAK